MAAVNNFLEIDWKNPINQQTKGRLSADLWNLLQGCSESDERNYVYRVLYDLVYVDLIEVVLVYAGAKFRRLVFRKKNVGKIPDRPFVAARLEKNWFRKPAYPPLRPSWYRTLSFCIPLSLFLPSSFFRAFMRVGSGKSGVRSTEFIRIGF